MSTPHQHQTPATELELDDVVRTVHGTAVVVSLEPTDDGRHLVTLWHEDGSRSRTHTVHAGSALFGVVCQLEHDDTPARSSSNPTAGAYAAGVRRDRGADMSARAAAVLAAEHGTTLEALEAGGLERRIGREAGRANMYRHAWYLTTHVLEALGYKLEAGA